MANKATRLRTKGFVFGQELIYTTLGLIRGHLRGTLALNLASQSFWRHLSHPSDLSKSFLSLLFKEACAVIKACLNRELLENELRKSNNRRKWVNFF